MQIIQGKTRRQRVMERALWAVLRERAEDGLLRALILDFKPRLANRCKLFPVYTIVRASILDFKPKLANRCSTTIVVAVENGPPAAVVAATNSASDSILRCGKGDKMLNVE